MREERCVCAWGEPRGEEKKIEEYMEGGRRKRKVCEKKDSGDERGRREGEINVDG